METLQEYLVQCGVPPQPEDTLDLGWLPLSHLSFELKLEILVLAILKTGLQSFQALSNHLSVLSNFEEYGFNVMVSESKLRASLHDLVERDRIRLYASCVAPKFDLWGLN